MDLLIATRNDHKLQEIRALLAGMGVTLRGLDDIEVDLPAELPETGDTFEANALQKARFVADHTGLLTLADDSGLEVRSLGGAPGIHSKRFSPQAEARHNNALLLSKLADQSDRQARFVCVVALVTPSFEGTVRGICDGTIALAHRGDGGFGYDPLFLPTDLDGRSMAEATMTEKNAISHRGRAFRELPSLLSKAGLLGQPRIRTRTRA